MVIRGYRLADRMAIRRICYDTAFLESAQKIIDDEEILTDFLTLYYTDWEPESCFVAVENEEVIGYIIGTKDIKRMKNVMIFRIMPRLILKAFFMTAFFKRKHLKFLWFTFKSFLKGDFNVPDISQEYPASLHINIQKDYRNSGFGLKLMECFLIYLSSQKIQGVQLGTMSEQAKNFFLKQGFHVIFSRKHSHLKYQLGTDIPIYLMGKKL